LNQKKRFYYRWVFKGVKCYFGDYRSHELNSWNNFLQLLFGQMTVNSICFSLKSP